MRVLAAAGVSVVCLCGWPGGASATVITVNTDQDLRANADGLCPLREAINSATGNVQSGAPAGECPAGSSNPDTVAVPAGVYNLSPLAKSPGSTSSALFIQGDGGPLTISGAGESQSILHGANTTAHDARLFWITSPTVTIEDMTLAGGGARPGMEAFDPSGGAIWNSGALTITRCAIRDSHTVSSGSGGANWQQRALTVQESTPSGNFAGRGGPSTNSTGSVGQNGGTGGSATGGAGVSGGNGGAIASSGPLTVSASRFTSNAAGQGATGGFGYAGAGAIGVNVGSPGGA